MAIFTYLTQVDNSLEYHHKAELYTVYWEITPAVCHLIEDLSVRSMVGNNMWTYFIKIEFNSTGIAQLLGLFI